MRALLLTTIVGGVLVFLYLYFEAKARVYRGKMESFATSSQEAGASAPPQDAAVPVADPPVEPGEAAVDDDDVDAGGKTMGLRERRLV
jgi:hypothetical protein